MPLNIATLRAELTGAPSYRIASSGETTYAILGVGALHLTSDDPTELRRLADVLENAADVLEQAQKPRAAPVPKCCDAETHDWMRRERDFFEAMPLVGYQDDGAGGRLELRNCHCGTTLARQMKPGEVEPVEVERGGMAVAR